MSGPLAAAGSLAGGGHPVECGRAKLVVTRSLFLVRKDVVGVLELLESSFGRLVAGVDVGMVLARQRAVSLLDGLGRCVASHAQNLVIIAIWHRATDPGGLALVIRPKLFSPKELYSSIGDRFKRRRVCKQARDFRIETSLRACSGPDVRFQESARPRAF